MFSFFSFRSAWQEPHSEHQIIETTRSAQVVPLRPASNASHRVDTSSSFIKFLHENTTVSRNPLINRFDSIRREFLFQLGLKWDRLLVPVKEPFSLNMTNDQVVQQALAAFKLVKTKKKVRISKRNFFLDFTFCEFG